MTCEQYVVNELIDAKAKIEDLEDEKKMLIDDIRELRGVIACLKENAILNCHDGKWYIDFSNVWELYENKDFNLFCKVFGFRKEDVDV